MNYEDIKPMLVWRMSLEQSSDWTPVELADLLTVKQTPNNSVPAKYQAAVTSFRKRKVKERVKLCCRFLDGRKFVKRYKPMLNNGGCFLGMNWSQGDGRWIRVEDAEATQRERDRYKAALEFVRFKAGARRPGFYKIANDALQAEE